MIAFEKSVGAVIFRKEEKDIKYLLLDYGNNYWGLAKGHIEEGESEIETLKREAKEETGLDDLKILDGFRETVSYLYIAKGLEKEERKREGRKAIVFKRAVFYLAETLKKNIELSEEHINFKWLSFQDMVSQISFRAPKKVLEKSEEFLRKNDLI